MSSLVFAAVTDGLAAVQARVLDAVAARISLLDLPDIGSSVVQLRNTERLYDQVPSVPTVVVTCYLEAEQTYGGDLQADEIGYPVNVLIIAPTLRDQDDTDQRRKEFLWREEIEDAFLYQRLAGVPEIATCLPEPRAIAERNDDTGPSELVRSSILLRFVGRKRRGAF